MWKPEAVVPEHRWRAKVVWVGLLTSIAAYTIWQIWKIFDGYKNISTRLEVTNEVYQFPFLLVCFFHGQGCGYESGSTDQCVADALQYSTVYGADGEEIEGIVVASRWDMCVGYDLTKIDMDGVADDMASVTISAGWVQTDIASTEVDFRDHVGIYISDEEPTEAQLTYLSVPFTRIIPDDAATVDLSAAELTIGKTTKKKLNGDVETTYPGLLISSSTYTVENLSEPSLADEAYGNLYFSLRQGAFSRTSVEEISPLDIGGFLGNIGGFWELLLIFWGVFFIATREDREPKLKARNLVKSVAKGRDIVTRRRSLSVDSSVSASRVEERPHWESAFQGNHPAAPPPALPPRGGDARAGGTAAAAGFPVLNSAKKPDSVATRRASDASSTASGGTSNGHHRGNGAPLPGGYKRPVVSDAPRRGSRSGGSRPSSYGNPPSYTDMYAV